MRLVAAACLLVACGAHESAQRPRPAKPAPLAAPGLRLPDSVVPLSYDLRLDIDPGSEIFRGEVTIQARVERPTDHVWLHADQLDIASARWDGGDLEIADTRGEQMLAFQFGRVVQPGPVTLSLVFSGKMMADQEGLFRQRDGAWYVFSQGEAVFARRFVPCFDEPRFKTPWKLTLVVPKQHVALSNMPEQSSTVLRDRKEVVFAETPPLPSYLVAVAVGPFELVDAGAVGRNRIPVRVVVRQGQGKRAGVVALRFGAIVDAMEAYLDDPLPVTKLDLVGVPQFFGAMENPGLITFHETILLGDSKKQTFANYFTFIAAHELAHQWFGNLVTPAWWDHLWLSEAFASWLGDKIVREVGAYEDPPLRFAMARREAIDADRAGDVKPLWRHVTTTAEADEGFDSIAYAKGQLVLASFEAFLGTDAFRTLVRSYMRGHRSVTSDDFIRAFPDTAVATSLQRIVRGAGTPVVELALTCNGEPKLVASASQPVPTCVRFGTTRACALVDKRTEIAIGPACPATLLGNADGGYYHTRWTTHGPRGPAPPVLDLDPASRIIAGDDVAAAIHRGELAAPAVLAELKAFADSRDPYAQLGAIAIARSLEPLVDDATRPAWESWLAARFADRLGVKKDRSAAELELGDALGAVMPADRFATEITRRTYAILDKLLPDAHGELPGHMVALAAVHGGDKLFDRIATRARLLRDAEARESWLSALGEFGPAQVPKAVALVTTGDLDPATAWLAVARYLERGATRTAAWKAVKVQLGVILQRMAGEAGDVIDGMSGLCDQASRDDVAATFAIHAKDIADGPTRLSKALSTIDACISRRAKLGDLGAAIAAAR